MIKQGDRLRISPKWADPGDDQIVFVAVDDESQGRVTIMAMLALNINPTQVVSVEMVDRVEEDSLSYSSKSDN